MRGRLLALLLTILQRPPIRVSSLSGFDTSLSRQGWETQFLKEGIVLLASSLDL